MREQRLRPPLQKNGAAAEQRRPEAESTARTLKVSKKSGAATTSTCDTASSASVGRGFWTCFCVAAQ